MDVDVDDNSSCSDTDNGSISSSGSSEDDFQFLELLVLNMINEYENKFLNKIPVRISTLTGQEFMNELMQGSGTTCYELLRMEKACFISFCNELRTKGFLEDSTEVKLDEKVAVFLYIICHNVRQRVVADRFQHSTETVSRYFKEVFTEWENMDPTQVEDLTLSTNFEVESLTGNRSAQSTSYNLDNLSRLYDQSAVEMSALRDQISARMWLHYRNSII